MTYNVFGGTLNIAQLNSSTVDAGFLQVDWSGYPSGISVHEICAGLIDTMQSGACSAKILVHL